MQTEKISTKVINAGGSDSWRPYMKPQFAAAGANDTGLWEDSPCNSNQCAKELNAYCKALRKEGIAYKRKTVNSANVFMVRRFIVVAASNLDRAQKIAEEMAQKPDFSLLYKA